MTTKKIIKRSLRRALAKGGRKQKWLAEQIGESEITLSRWANADHLSTGKIEKVAKPFGLSVSEFISLGE